MVTTITTTYLTNNPTCSENRSSQATISMDITVNRHTDESRTVTWDSSAIDNEHMNKKSSKCCCIYTGKQRDRDSSSDDEVDNRDSTKRCDHHKNK